MTSTGMLPAHRNGLSMNPVRRSPGAEFEAGLEPVLEGQTGQRIGNDRSRQPSPSPVVQVPRHPIPSMQDAFAESLVEATGGATAKPKFKVGSAKTRRDVLLDQAKAEQVPGALWRRRPGQNQHELRRLLAQISFGVYLLLNGLANSQISVVSILQGHIDEVDEYLETTMEDTGLAIQDLKDRVEHLKLPLSNPDVFDQMLEDRNFRMQTLEGNERIEHIVERTQAALVQTVKDLSEGLKATKQFVAYLEEQQTGRWRQERADVNDIFDAMKANTEGWYNAFLDLQSKGNTLNGLSEKLITMVAEIESRAGEVSRRTRFSVQPYTSPAQSPRGSLQQSPRHSPHHSRQTSTNSFASSSTPASPLSFRIANSPPRLSLRLSTFSPKVVESESAYFGIPLGRDTMGPFQYQPPDAAAQIEPVPEQAEKEVVVDIPQELEADVFTAVPARNPRRISRRVSNRISSLAIPHLEIPDEIEEPEDDETAGKEEADNAIEETLFILQPRTYTPVPPAPVPSPRVPDDPTRNAEPPRSTRTRERSPASPRSVITREPSREPSRDPPRSGTPQRQREREDSFDREVPKIEPPTLMDSPTLRAVAYVPSPSPSPKPKPRVLRVDQPLARPLTSTETPKLRVLRVDQPLARPLTDTPAEVHAHPVPKQRTSLRQRVSLKTTPPESIQVPPPHATELQRPSYASPRAYQGPDSAYGSERHALRSVASSLDPSLEDFPPPVLRPTLLPSPQSDQQYFRPVQASPHSPLQQRPHTSGTMNPRFPTDYQPHQRNIPSAMGMSMLSNVTTMTTETAGGKTLKKKRSAFGWLKKAFSLDEEERLAFEQKKREQAPNPYYDGRSPQFLDGRRIQPPRDGYRPSHYGG